MDNKEVLNSALKNILKIYLKEFSKYIDSERMEYLSNERNLPNIIKFSQDGFGAWCKGLNIMFGSNTAFFIEKLIKKTPNYKANPGIELVTQDEFINNEKDYLDYIKYFTLKGCTELDYYLDMLPHETMHLIGISGGVLSEGVTEKRTREMCFKYGIRVAPVLHSKETKLIGLMEEIVDKEVLNRMGFAELPNKYNELQRMLDAKCGSGTFKKVFNNTESMYTRVYLNKDYDNPIDKFIAYREKLNFSSTYDLLNKKIKEKSQIDI